MALLRIGSLMKLISPSVLTGFVTGSGVYIFFTQSKYIWGFKVRGYDIRQCRLHCTRLIDAPTPRHRRASNQPTNPHGNPTTKPTND